MSRSDLLTERVRFSMPVDELARITERAKELGISRSELFRRIIDRAIAREDGQDPPADHLQPSNQK